MQLRHLQLDTCETELHKSLLLSLQVASSKLQALAAWQRQQQSTAVMAATVVLALSEASSDQPCCWLQDSSALALQVAVLLLGPRGSGRSTAVRAAAAALGIHFVPFTCHDLKGQTDAETATALKASLEAAQGYAPVVLMLRHFEVLAESPNGATPGRKRDNTYYKHTIMFCMKCCCCSVGGMLKLAGCTTAASHHN
jgi:hypothetical protein